MAGRAFLSYAREDKTEVAEVERRLRRLGFDVWLDLTLRGGQVWWDEILDQIRRSDVFIAIISTASLDSQACTRERAYADALGKPIVPVEVEHPRAPLPVDIVTRQIVDYTPGSADAAFSLASALIGVPTGVALPDPLPLPPEIPLSYLTRLVALSESGEEIPRSRQHEMLSDLEPGLRAHDPEERIGAWHVLGILEARPDLYADAARRIQRLREEYSDRQPTAADPTGADHVPAVDAEVAAAVGEEGKEVPGPGVDRAGEATDPEQGLPSAPPRPQAGRSGDGLRQPPVNRGGESSADPDRGAKKPWWRQSWVMAVAAAALVVAVVAGILSVANGPAGRETVSAGGSDEVEEPQTAPELPVRIEGDVSSPAFDAEIASLAETTGIEVTFDSVPETELRSRVVSDDPPDIVILGSPRSLHELGEFGALESLGDVLDVGALEDSMVPGLMASVQSPRGTTFGVPVSIDVKSLVWHPVPEFEDAGYWVPPTHQEFVQLTDQIRSDGATPWCFGIGSGEATGWPMTDWIEEYVLRIGGPEVYDAWVRHEIPFTDPVVKQAAEAVAELLLVDGNTVAGSGPAIAELPFDESAQPLVEDPPGCYLHRQASFVTQFWPQDALPALSEVVGFFALPPYDGGWPGRPVLGVGSVAAIVSGANARAPEVLQTMASPRWGYAWARDGVFVSPSLEFDPDSYADILQGAVADVAASADAFRLDGSDQMPVTVSDTFSQVMTAWVRGETSLDAALEQVEASWPD